MALGQALGIRRDTLFEILIGGPMVAPFVKGKQAIIEDGKYEAHFPLKWMEKDLHLAALSAHEVDTAIPAGAVAKEIYALAARKGLGELDFSAIYRFINEVDAQ
jgi:3-hydroxyisobutyrate dehydrogenase/glyoxylate/succinic semialdehyde reductase